VFEFIFDVFGELIIQLVLELLVRIGTRSATRFQKPLNPWLAATAYLCVGASLGFSSLLFVSNLVITNPTLRFVNLLISPIAAGLCMWSIGRWRAKRGKDAHGLDTFLYGFMFALAFGLARFLGK
jgi:hypothetical protein